MSRMVSRWLAERLKVGHQTIAMADEKSQAKERMGGPRRETTLIARAEEETADGVCIPGGTSGEQPDTVPIRSRAASLTVRHASATGRAAKIRNVQKARSPAASQTPTTTTAAKWASGIIICPLLIGDIAKPWDASAPG